MRAVMAAALLVASATKMPTLATDAAQGRAAIRTRTATTAQPLQIKTR